MHLYQEDVMNSNDYKGVQQVRKRQQRKAIFSHSEEKQDIETELENQLGEFKLPKIWASVDSDSVFTFDRLQLGINKFFTTNYFKLKILNIYHFHL